MAKNRIDKLENIHLEGRCHLCGKNFGVIYIYAKENRPAIRLFVGSIKKRLIK